MSGLDAERERNIRQLKQQGMTYAKIGTMLGISRQRVQQIASPPLKQTKELINSANGICSLCHKKVKKIELHHTNYITNELQPICTSCHKILHRRGPEMTIRKMIAVDMDTYDYITKMAEDTNRTMGGMVAYIAKQYKRLIEQPEITSGDQEIKISLAPDPELGW